MEDKTMNQSRELIKKRQERLFDYISLNKSIRVTDASLYLDVSEITVRRDLIYFEEKNLVERFHGGARLKNTPDHNDELIDEKEIKHKASKNAIGKKAAELIKDNSTVFLNSGSTTLAVLKYLNNKSIRIITNNALAPTCIWNEQIELILTGGECRCRSKSLIGSFASNMISNVYADTCILGVNGISSEHGTTTSIHQETIINEMMVKRCNGSIIIVADGSKIGKTFDFLSIEIKNIDILITDSNADSHELQKLRDKGIQVITIDVNN